MFRLAWLLMPLAIGRLRTSARNAKRRVAYLALAGVLGLIALGFALVTVTVLIAGEIGLLAALGVMTAVAALAAIAIVVALRIGERRRRAEASPLSQVPSSAYTSALIRSLRSARRPSGRGVVGLGLLALGLVLMVMQGNDDDDGD